jgi:hypothetical protein
VAVVDRAGKAVGRSMPTTSIMPPRLRMVTLTGVAQWLNCGVSVEMAATAYWMPAGSRRVSRREHLLGVGGEAPHAEEDGGLVFEKG